MEGITMWSERGKRASLVILVAVTALFLLASVALGSIAPAVAQSGNGYDLTWSTVDGGGYTFSTGGGYTLGGTIGQPDAGGLTGGNYTLGGGFWGSIVEYLQRVLLPLILKNFTP
jgi:hypothetical protein